MTIEEITFLKNKLNECSEKNIKEIRDEEFLDVESIKYNSNDSVKDKVLFYIENSRNPYAIKTKDVKIFIKFKNDGLSINDCLLNIINAKVQ